MLVANMCFIFLFIRFLTPIHESETTVMRRETLILAGLLTCLIYPSSHIIPLEWPDIVTFIG